MRDNMVVMGHWLENCESLTIEQKQEVYYWILRYGLCGEEIGEVKDPMAKMVLNFIVPQINKM